MKQWNDTFDKCFYINMNEFNDKQSFFINKVYCICLNCLVALNTKFKKGKFSIKLCKGVIMATCCFYSFNDMFLHEIKYVQSLKVMST